MKDFVETIVTQELIQKLIDRGYGDLVEAFLMNENKVTTKKGRINKSGLCRVLNWKSKRLEEILVECQVILAELNVQEV